MQNKPNFGNDKMNITIDMTSVYKILPRLPGPKNKPNSNPIKPISKPIKAKTNPIQTQSKPIIRNTPEFTLDVSSLALEFTLDGSLPAFLSGIGGFCVDKEPYNDIDNATRGIYNPKG
jgi:hypothetical protein